VTAYDPLTEDEMAELIENPMLVHLYDAHRLVAALATIRERRCDFKCLICNPTASFPSNCDHMALIAYLHVTLGRLIDAARPVLAIAAISYEGDPWFVDEQAKIEDAEGKMDTLRAVLGAAKEITDD